MNVIVAMAVPVVVENVIVTVVNIQQHTNQIMPKKELNHLGYPHDDPYGLVAAWWKIFTKPEKKNESNNTKKEKRINPKTRKISRRSL
tara:strand:- start:3444 stop:3707 length:264 start_codon:yes stop_codon:yes gene_type:complete